MMDRMHEKVSDKAQDAKQSANRINYGVRTKCPAQAISGGVR
jgi:hypothetical protein